MNKTKIDWADSSWNPVTGCLHGCEYCYARSMAHRFGTPYTGTDLHVVPAPPAQIPPRPYPYEFAPTLRRDRLGDPINSTGRTIFVCSMADLFGAWVPDEWIREVFEACKAAPQHRYLFLTKNPYRYVDLADKGILGNSPSFWYGSTITGPTYSAFFQPYPSSERYRTFISFEPILAPSGIWNHRMSSLDVQWIIVGAETGNRKGKVIPQREWIMDIKRRCAEAGVPLFMKASLHDLMGEDFIQEYPWDTGK